MNNFREKTFLLLFFCLFACFAQSQNLKNSGITIEVKNETVKNVFKKVTQASNYKFFYDENVMEDKSRITFNLSNTTLEKVLGEITRQTGLQFNVSENTITVNSLNVKPQKNTQEIKRKSYAGTVTDATGEPLIGATVVEKSTGKGDVTDIDGKFSIEADENALLRVTYLGYQTQEVRAAGGRPLSIVLQEDLKVLDEVVVVGYGTMKKRDLTGAISSISDRQFKNQPLTSATGALQGRLAGVDVTQLSGTGGVRIRVRGITSINKSNDPLVVIDGFIGGSLDNINPDDIQSIEVLKDASGTAVYGSRGACGVVLVTTKHGESGKAKVSFQSDNGWSKIYNTYDMLSPYEFAESKKLYAMASISDSEMEKLRTGEKGIDWWNLMTQTAVTQNYKMSISGGNEKSRYLVSGNYIDRTSQIIGTHSQTYRLRANIDANVMSWLDMSLDVTGNMDNSHNNTSSLMSFMRWDPTLDLKDPVTGYYLRDPVNNLGSVNPYGALKENQNDSKSQGARANLDLKFKILPGLTYSFLVGAGISSSAGFNYSAPLDELTKIATSSNRTYYNYSWQNTNNLTYDKTFAGEHHLIATAVWETSYAEGTMLEGSANELQSPQIITYYRLEDGLTRDARNSYSASSMESFFGRLFYSYKDRYMFTGTLRADGSSKFQRDYKWGYFPSGAVAWNAGEEDFVKSWGVFDQVKLRASLGCTGNQAIENYATQGLLQSTAYPYGNDTKTNGFFNGLLANPNLHWEKTIQYDAGVDMSILSQRLNINIDWYLKHTTDMLYKKAMPNYVGGSDNTPDNPYTGDLAQVTMWTNAAKMDNTGVEISIDAYPIRNAGFTWESVLTAAWQRNKVLDLAGSPYMNGGEGYGIQDVSLTRLTLGEPVGRFWLARYAGVNPENGRYQYYKADGSISTESPKYADHVSMGNSNPSYMLGLNNTFNFGNWEVNIFFNAALGMDRYNLMKAALNGSVSTATDGYYKGWYYLQKNGLDTSNALYSIPKSLDPQNHGYNGSDRWLENASYLRLKNVSITYHFPRKWLKVADAHLSISGQNLLCFTKYTGLDPETMNMIMSEYSYPMDLNSGFDIGAYPMPKMVNVGLRVDF